jgi:hypothetical protein
MFDIFLWTKSKSLPDISGLSLNSDLRIIINDKTMRALEGHPRFLGLDLPVEIATDLLDRLESQGARGLVVEAKYREPRISKETAFSIAERDLLERQKSYPTVEFDPLSFRREDVMWWEFCSVSPDWIEEGRIPGALLACVDKVDGHVWTKEDFEKFAGE